VGQEVGSRAVVCSYPQRCDSDTDQHEDVHRETAPPSEGGAAPVEDETAPTLEGGAAPVEGETAPDPAHLVQVCATTAFGSELPQHQRE
jgi:hypothetical protein